MRDETAAWLEPMLDKAHLNPAEFNALIAQATMPAAEACDTLCDWLTDNAPPAASVRALDWIRFGQLLRDRIGWSDYPCCPEHGPR